MKEVFSNIYHHNLWGDPESISGPGSTLSRTSAFRDQLALLLRTINARSVLDAACGDFNWMKEIDLSLDHYIGVDIVPEIVAANQRRYASSTVTFLDLDIAADEIPAVDVILCRDCLVHFSFEDAASAIRNLKRSKSIYLLTTTFTQLPDNVDIPTGGWRQMNLEIEPFNFPRPIALIDEKCSHTGGIYADKHLALWRLADITMAE